MTAMKGLLFGVLLSVMIGGSVSQGYGGQRGFGMYGGYGGGGGGGYSPGARFNQYCYIFNKEKWDEGHGYCHWKVLKEVFDKVKDFSRRDRYTVRELYRMSQGGMLCYMGGPNQGNAVIQILDPCQGFGAACGGRPVDYCSTLNARARPPAAPAPTPRPQPPATPRGRGI